MASNPYRDPRNGDRVMFLGDAFSARDLHDISEVDVIAQRMTIRSRQYRHATTWEFSTWQFALGGNGWELLSHYPEYLRLPDGV